jgi:hypothetical protein
MQLTDAVYRATQRPAGQALRKPIFDLRKAVALQHDTWKQAQEAIAAVEKNPADAEAASTAASWYLQRRDWQRALPLMAKSNNTALRSLAERDLAPPADAAAEVSLADGWYDAAQKANDTMRALLIERAAHWYRLAQPRIDSAGVKAKVDERLAAISDETIAAEPIPFAGQALKASGKRRSVFTTSGPTRCSPRPATITRSACGTSPR